ncbi:transposase [Candidatus Uabimicrobium amorphum]|uniref:Transposase n=1 Tax=Uabimicrobium amorphum TaxID=2596890 RepID=A0A5S9IQD2_UABAM|nr:IS21 family transposase [Candidatus Uabimicrobium amorphum]BBM86173.1 transposase [Candidatus Uabimicrobium amorphum]
MIKMDMYGYIRFAHGKLGKSINSIHRETKKARETIRKAIKGIEPKYRLTKPRRKWVMGPYMEIITKWLEEDKKVPVKQRHTAKKIYDRLVEEYSFKGAERTVRSAVREVKEKIGILNNESFIPSDPEKRHGSEVDWGEAYVDIKGSRVKVYMFCMRAKYSGKIFVKLYPTMAQECFFNGHIEAFAYYGGVFDELVYDNLKAAVQKVLRGRQRIEQQSFISFRSYYCFSPQFCSPAKGNEKGGVEQLVKYARRNFVTPIPECNSLEEINNKLLEQCLAHIMRQKNKEKITIGEKFQQEKSRLLKLPHSPYNNYKLIEKRVDKYQTITVDHNKYSAPYDYVNKNVVVELGLSDVRITYQSKLIARHQRVYHRGYWQLDPWHYMEMLRKKSRAFKSSRILTTIEEKWSPVVKELWNQQRLKYGDEKGTKEFIDSLLLFKNKDYGDMISVIELAIENNTFCKASIQNLYDALTEKEIVAGEASVDHIKAIKEFDLPQPDVNKFDQLMEGQNAN